MKREYHFYVYILQSASRRALYIGITNNLCHRVFQHKTHQFEGFTDDYNAVRLVYWEHHESVGKAIAREKQLKRWRREKKMWLIEKANPVWRDLAADWFPQLTTNEQVNLSLTAKLSSRAKRAKITRSRGTLRFW